jgi:hypothetical protein
LRIKSSHPILVRNDFDPVAASSFSGASSVSWVDISGNPASAPDFSLLPDPLDVLAGRVEPDFGALRFRSKETFRAGLLCSFFPAWKRMFSGLPEFQTVEPWLRDGVNIPSFFQLYEGSFNGRLFNSIIPPPMYYQNAPICQEYSDFITDTITLRLKEGSMLFLGKVGQVPPPRVLNALSIEPIKPRLILSMRAVNLFCSDNPFSLVTLDHIVKPIRPNGFFSSTDDVQGYKQISLTPESYQFCGFEWGGFYFCDTTLPFGWKNSAFVYTAVGNVLSAFLKRQGVHTELWIDDRFVGEAPPTLSLS